MILLLFTIQLTHTYPCRTSIKSNARDFLIIKFVDRTLYYVIISYYIVINYSNLDLILWTLFFVFDCIWKENVMVGRTKSGPPMQTPPGGKFLSSSLEFNKFNKVPEQFEFDTVGNISNSD